MKNNLALKTYISSAVLMVVLALVTFISADTIKFTRGWVLIIAIGVPSFLISYFSLKTSPNLSERRLKGGPTAEKRGAQKILQLINGISYLLVLIIGGLNWRFGWPQIPNIFLIIGIIIILCGYFGVYLVFRENEYASATIGVESNQKLIETGPYSLVRHPMYTATSLILIGMPLVIGAYFSFLPVLVLLVGVYFRSIDEEKNLNAEMPGYSDYSERVKYRFIKGVI